MTTYTALITGGTSGIGYELAKLMASHGHDLVLVARNKADLDRTEDELLQSYDVAIRTVTSDLSLPGSAKQLYSEVKADNVAILINNAGSGLKGDFFRTELAKQQAMAHLNMISPMELMHYFGADFVNRGHGRILNITSIAAFAPGPKQPTYFATKAFVRSLSRSLSYTLRGSGVTVTTLHPGITKTNFFNSANAATVTNGASARSVAELGYKAMMAGKREVTHGFRNKLFVHGLLRVTPNRWHPSIVDRLSDA